ncbi:hypothetical protein FCR2A7T_07000 [Flavobacterium cauense R2A-7]|uniref:Uncharacterized protein n=1 Tax=Flavobacterium cauense R2A-7 TaxID=1341154 RepID=V6S3B7_9FLAO|nr:hypothetical protein [Flavobacterium cauense]ESU21168.1 hypothetical protein FCR2A7T_07000 [Flavobacterium cauense R2A-7]KGO79296.1 hypothetical protein Q762_14470 [Flavobacterium cauense R2A-7]TWI07904.1 hypothetical protein IP98_02926 [Flavobacterium cauense R2A-7]
MRILTILAIFFIALSCKKNEEKTNLDSARIENINQIVKAIIVQDSLKILKTDKNPIELFENLRKLRIYIPTKEDIEIGAPPPPPTYAISINQIIKTKIKGQRFFSAKDSLNFINQYRELDSLKINPEILRNVVSTSTKKAKLKTKIDEGYYFCEMTIPLFSKDTNKAYVELAYYCGRLCGGGKSIFLEKINGEWKIIESYSTWVS